MNPDTPPPTPPAAPPQKFYGWLRGLDIVRQDDGWGGGVASGISRKIGLDVIIVRGIFIVFSLFSGIGPLLYGLAWALLPDQRGRIHTEAVGHGRWSAGMTGASILVLIGLLRDGFGFDIGFFQPFPKFWPLILIVAVVFIIMWAVRRGNGTPSNPPVGPEAKQPPYSAYPMPAAATATENVASTTATTTAVLSYSDDGEPVYPSFDIPTQPVADSGYYDAEAPEYPPYTAPVPRPRVLGPTSGSVLIGLGLAVLAGGAVYSADLLGAIDLGAAALTVSSAVALFIMGVSIIVVGARGRSSGFLGFFGGLLLAVTLVSGAGWQAGSWSVASQAKYAPVSVTEAEAGYNIAMANGVLDLTKLRIDPGSAAITIPVKTGMSNLTVRLPESLRVRVDSTVAMGAIRYEDHRSAGFWSPDSVRLGPDTGPIDVILDLRGAMTSISVVEVRD